MNEKSRVSRLLLVIWFAFVIAGYSLMVAYSSTAARTIPAVAALPENFGFADRNCRHAFNLIVCLHPQCPCSQATVGELEKILDRTNAKDFQCTVYLSKPAGTGPRFVEGNILNALNDIKAKDKGDLEVIIDDGDKFATRLNVKTSGHIFLFDRYGKRLFDGGITAARGHAGDNAGADFIIDCLRKNTVRKDSLTTAQATRTPVFGCSMESGNDKN